jgi:hypothetical protein
MSKRRKLNRTLTFLTVATFNLNIPVNVTSVEQNQTGPSVQSTESEKTEISTITSGSVESSLCTSTNSSTRGENAKTSTIQISSSKSA